MADADLKAMLQLLSSRREERSESLQKGEGLQKKARDGDAKALEREESLQKEARVRDAKARKERALGEERYAALLTSISGTAVPVQNAEQLLILTSLNRALLAHSFAFDKDSLSNTKRKYNTKQIVYYLIRSPLT